MALQKRNPGVLLAHGAVVLVAAQLATGGWMRWELIALAAVHIAVDATKTWGRFTGPGAYVVDQGAHLASLVLVAVFVPDLFPAGPWGGAAWLPDAFILAAGALIATRAGSFAIGLLMAPYADHAPSGGIENGGRIIGYLERGLIFLLVLTGNPAGIGFLIAAKSVLRFDVTSGKDAKDHRAAEYVIIGTLASFGWALAVSFGMQALRAHLPVLVIPLASP
jgi:hypothetical protein